MLRQVLTVMALATPLAAEPMLVDNPAACAGWDPESENALSELMGDLNMVLLPSGLEAVEYHCEFEEPVIFDWTHGEPVIRAGYCMEPGPNIFPTVFVLGFWPGEEGRAYVWQTDASGNGEPHVFHACPAG